MVPKTNSRFLYHRIKKNSLGSELEKQPIDSIPPPTQQLTESANRSKRGLSTTILRKNATASSRPPAYPYDFLRRTRGGGTVPPCPNMDRRTEEHAPGPSLLLVT